MSLDLTLPRPHIDLASDIHTPTFHMDDDSSPVSMQNPAGFDPPSSTDDSSDVSDSDRPSRESPKDESPREPVLVTTQKVAQKHLGLVFAKPDGQLELDPDVIDTNGTLETISEFYSREVNPRSRPNVVSRSFDEVDNNGYRFYQELDPNITFQMYYKSLQSFYLSNTCLAGEKGWDPKDAYGKKMIQELAHAENMIKMIQSVAEKLKSDRISDVVKEHMVANVYDMAAKVVASDKTATNKLTGLNSKYKGGKGSPMGFTGHNVKVLEKELAKTEAEILAAKQPNPTACSIL